MACHCRASLRAALTLTRPRISPPQIRSAAALFAPTPLRTLSTSPESSSTTTSSPSSDSPSRPDETTTDNLSKPARKDTNHLNKPSQSARAPNTSDTPKPRRRRTIATTPSWRAKQDAALDAPPDADVDVDPKPAKQTWQAQKAALAKKFPLGWSPPKRLSPDALSGLRALHAQFPETYTTPALADLFGISPEAVRRILKSKWSPEAGEEEEERRERWVRRGVRVWEGLSAKGMKVPRRWREEGVVSRAGPVRAGARGGGRGSLEVIGGRGVRTGGGGGWEGASEGNGGQREREREREERDTQAEGGGSSAVIARRRISGRII
ncbi:uncharacterized protein DNG_06162 [Cephalotrichum gorgonifer]|uniref:Required for respiratory growth protein 9, mitochondrial n=1 Tax=Cephalotrichum gorgonifer TaxID=2041049 RepID=A0AAE8SWC5_9PEZI|nr:uncharacterized protein DNG_06162 [Cephalotrichum gorgonifer]